MTAIGLAIDLGRTDLDSEALVARYSELLGSVSGWDFHSVWAGETYGRPGDTSGHISSPMLALAALAGSTPARLGVGVTLLPAWHPLRLAYDCAVLDAMTGGRLILGTGVGREPLWNRFGLEPGHVGAFVDDSLQALKALWAGATGFVGETFEIEGGISPRPAREGGPPLWVGGKSSAAIRRAAQLGDAYFAGSSTSLQEIRDLSVAYRTALAEARPGQSGHVAVNRIALVTESRDIALAAANTHLRRWHDSYHSRGLTDSDFDEATRGLMLLGSADDVLDDLEEYAAAGIDQVNLRIAPIGVPFEVVDETLARVCESRLVKERSA